MSRIVAPFGIMLGVYAAAACNSADYSVSGPCTGSSCTCEQDPTIPRCKGFNEKPETGADLPDGAFQFDAAEASTTDAADAEAGPDDASDDGG